MKKAPCQLETFSKSTGTVRGLLAFACLVLIFLLTACRPGAMAPDSPALPSGIRKVLVLPFKDMAAIYGEGVNVRCMLCGTVLTTGKVEADAPALMTDHLTTLLRNHKNFTVIPASQAQGVLPAAWTQGQKMSELDILLETGQALEVDAVVMGHIFRFQERAGTRYAAKTPASVTFDVDIIGMNEKKVLWNGLFNETQQSLFENLFNIGTFFKRKGKFITAKEMATAALDELFQQLLPK